MWYVMKDCLLGRRARPGRCAAGSTASPEVAQTDTSPGADAHGRIAARRALAVATALTAMTLLLPACAGSSARLGNVAPPMATLIIDSHPEDVSVYIDGAYVGTAAEVPGGTLPVPASARRLELRSEGYHPHRLDLVLEPEHSYTLRVRLVRDLR